MFTHEDLSRLQAQSLKMQGWIRQQTFSPELEKTLRRFSSWEVAELIFKVNQSTLRGRLATDPTLPQGHVEEDGRQRWYALEEINEIRRRLRINRKSMMPERPAGKRALRAAIANFLGTADYIRGSGVAFEGTGFRAAAVRSIVSGLTMLARQPYQHKVFDAVPTTMAWLVPELTQHLSLDYAAADAIDAVGRFRARVDEEVPKRPY